MPGVYHQSVLAENGSPLAPAADPHCLATFKHYRSLVPMAQEARKPIFDLTPADGAIGNHAVGVQEAFRDFEALAGKILTKMTAQAGVV